jgi:hypothetical protein
MSEVVEIEEIFKAYNHLEFGIRRSTPRLRDAHRFKRLCRDDEAICVVGKNFGDYLSLVKLRHNLGPHS